MRGYLIVAAACAALSVAACNPNSNKDNPAVDTTPGASDSTSTTAPAAGANSFTMDQARDRITAAGYQTPTNLVQSADGVWRGTAMKGGQSVDVAVDYQGNVTTAAAGSSSGASSPTGSTSTPSSDQKQ